MIYRCRCGGDVVSVPDHLVPTDHYVKDPDAVVGGSWCGAGYEPEDDES